MVVDFFAASVDLAGALEAVVEAGAFPAVEAGLGAIVRGYVQVGGSKKDGGGGRTQRQRGVKRFHADII